MKQRTRIAALLLCVCFVLVSACSVWLLANHAGHHCEEDHCAVCLWVDHTFQLLKQLRGGVYPAMHQLIVLITAISAAAAAARFLPCRTPVSLKIQMNH